MFQFFKEKSSIYRKGIKHYTNLFFFIAGEIFEPENCNDIMFIYKFIKEKNINFLKNLKGEYNFFIEDERFVYILIDEIGTIKWFYSLNNQNILISNNFWSIIKKVKPSVESIDKNALYESILLYKSLNDNTFIKNVNIFPAATLTIIDKKTHDIQFIEYKKTTYKPDYSLNKVDVFDKLEYFFSKTIDKINKFNNYPYIGITISGGLDSRFPLPYVKKEQVKVTYMIGNKNNLLKPFDYDSAISLSKLFRFKFRLIDPFSISFEDKKLIDILRNPTTNSNILKAINYNSVFYNDNFDVLITGAYGGLIGGRVLNDDLLKSSINDLTYYLFRDYSIFNQFRYLNRSSSNKLLKLFNYLFLDKNNLRSKNNIAEDIDKFIRSDFLFPGKEKENIFFNLNKYIEKNSSKFDNRLSFIMNFHVRFHSIRGAFESLHGQVKSYSIYSPYIYEFSKRWPIEYLKNRKIMEEFLFYKYPEIAKIPLQNYNLPIFNRYSSTNDTKNFFLKVKYISLFQLKQLAINYTKWWNNKIVKNDVFETFFNDKSYFYEIFKKEDVLTIINNSVYTHLAENLFKAKLLVDLIESKNYELLEDKFRYTTKF